MTQPDVWKSDQFGDPKGLSTAFDELAILVADHKKRLHDRAAYDRMVFAARDIQQHIRFVQAEFGDELEDVLAWTLIWLTERTIKETP